MTGRRVCALVLSRICAGWAVACLLLAGCVSPHTVPDLQALYRTASGNPEQPPLILIPGALGTRLVDGSGDEVWPGGILDLLSSDYAELAMEVDPETLEPGDGTVTKASQLARDTPDPRAPRHHYLHFPARSVFFFCEEHTLLAGNITFQDNFLHALLSVD